MLKKLLVAVLALTIIVGLFSPALAANTKTGIISLDQPVPRDRAPRSSPGCTYEVDEYYYSGATSILRLPDAYGDDFFNTRFTNGVPFELQYIECTFYKPYTTLGAGATIYAWKSLDGFPDLSQVIYSAPVNPIPFPSGNFMYIGVPVPDMPAFSGDFHVGFSPIVNAPGQRVGILADANATNGRSSEYYGAWGTMLDDWGTDYAFLIDAYKCATPPPPCVATADPTDQWPVWCHDFGRSSQTGIALGADICGIANAWTYDLGMAEGAYRQIARTAPLIVNDLVYVFYVDRVVCFNLLTGVPAWTSKTLPWGNTVAVGIGPALLSNPCIVDGYLYMGTGGAVAGGGPGFMKIDAATGTLVWSRGAGLGGAELEGTASTTAIATPVVIGDKVFFGTQQGIMYALYTATGATAYYSTLPTEGGLTAKLMGSISSDGTNLFIGTANATAVASIATGRVYSFLPNGVGFTQNWVYNQPAAVLAAYPGGFWSAPSYRNGYLFIQSVAVRNATTGYCGFRQCLIAADGSQHWYSDVVQGAARQSPPATICSGVDGALTAIYASYNTSGYQGNGDTRGVKAVNMFNGTEWDNAGGANWENQVFCAATVTQDPWVFYGANDTYGQNALQPYGGNWIITDGLTGDIFAQYSLSGPVNGTSIAHGSDGKDYIVVTTQWSKNGNGPTNGGGLVLAFTDQGARPRLVVPGTYLEFTSTDDAEPTPVQRTAYDAILNTGCADMTYSAPFADVPLKARVSTVSFAGQQVAADLAAKLIDRTVDDMTPFNEPKTSDVFVSSLVLNAEGDWSMPATQVKPALANSARLAPPTWVTWVDGETGTIPGGGSADFTFQFDLSQMSKLGVNVFYVQVSTDDPDYNPEIIAPAPQGVQAELAYSMPYRYCALDIDTMSFGTIGKAWHNNTGVLGGGDYAVEFAPSNATGETDHLFQGSVFYMNDMASAAWNPTSGSTDWDPLIDGGFLYGFYPTGTDCGGCLKNVTLPAVEYTTNGGVSYSSLTGDICTSAMVDSGQDMGYYPYQDGPSMGLLIKQREIGVYGAAFSAFKLTIQDIINRNATPINGLYYGTFIDWDVQASNVDSGGGDAVKGYIYQYGSLKSYGTIGLPSKGSYWPDGTKTDPMYNARLMAASDYQQDLQFDSLYDWADKYPEHSFTAKPLGSTSTNPDKSSMATYGKVNLAGYGQHSFGFVDFGIVSGFTGPTQIETIMKFANKLSGFGRGDVDGNDVINLVDLVKLSNYVALPLTKPGPTPFKHLGDVNCDGLVNAADVTLLYQYFFAGGTPPKSTFVF
jgi:hypothetical protein